MNETFHVIPGGVVESYQAHGFNQIYGVWINNFSGGWLSVEGQNLWCPPYTRGWKATIFPATSQITVRSYNFANGARIAGATGQAAQVTIWSEPQGDSEGISFFNEQTIPLVSYDDITAAMGATVIVPAPPIGRIRIYEIRANLSDNGVSMTSTPMEVMLYGSIAGWQRFLAVSPATPHDLVTFVAPGGDLPIGSSLGALVTNYPNTYGITDNNVIVQTVYAVI